MFGASNPISITRDSFGARTRNSNALNKAIVQPSDSIRSSFTAPSSNDASKYVSTLPLFLTVTSILPLSPGLSTNCSPTSSIVKLWNVCISRLKFQLEILLSKLDSASKLKVGPVPANGAPSLTTGVIIQKVMKISSPSSRSI